MSFGKGGNSAAQLHVAVEAGAGSEASRRVDAVLLSATGERLGTARYPRREQGGEVVLYRFDLGVLPDSVALVGVEWATPEGIRALSEQAQGRARELGMPVLPYPEVGQPFPFDVEMGEAGAARHSQYAGKVVLIDCWASWCVPCMEAMPDLIEVYREHHGAGLEVVGMNFDFDRSAAKKAIAEHSLAWNNVLLGASPELLDLWYDASGVGGIPRLFLLDRQGVLRWDSLGASREQLSAQVEPLL
jgi:thiol-disulfide isomerase/thioredoxin